MEGKGGSKKYQHETPESNSKLRKIGNSATSGIWRKSELRERDQRWGPRGTRKNK